MVTRTMWAFGDTPFGRMKKETKPGQQGAENACNTFLLCTESTISLATQLGELIWRHFAIAQDHVPTVMQHMLSAILLVSVMVEATFVRK